MVIVLRIEVGGYVVWLCGFVVCYAAALVCVVVLLWCCLFASV